jgi:hypothetical protein
MKFLVVALFVAGCAAAVPATPEGATPTPVVTPSPAPTPTYHFTFAPEPTPEPTPPPTAKPLTFAQLKAQAKKVPYKTLFRNSADYVGDLIYFRGEVIQVIDVEGEPDKYQLRVNVTKGSYGIWKDTIFLYYAGKRVLDDDIVQFVATYTDTITYESTGAGPITIPSAEVVRLIIE